MNLQLRPTQTHQPGTMADVAGGRGHVALKAVLSISHRSGSSKSRLHRQRSFPTMKFDSIHDASLRVLQEIGVDVLHDGAREIMKEAGADVTPGTMRVHFDKDMILEYVGWRHPSSPCMLAILHTMCVLAAII